MSISFDRIADRYDATRGFPEGVSAEIGAAFQRHIALPNAARLIEIGIGTGRIALPLAAQGYRYSGVDISPKMMQRLRQRITPDMTIDLIRADATALPLRNASYDAGIATHVFHLIAAWPQAIAELRRVIRPGGLFALGFNQNDPYSLVSELRIHWQTIVHELGGDTRRPGGTENDVDDLLRTTFGPPRQFTLASWERRISPRMLLEQTAARTMSTSWALTNTILDESIRRTTDWARTVYGDIDRLQTDTMHFMIKLYPA